MNSQKIVQQAMQCLQDLDLHSSTPQTSKAISERQHLPLSTCREILHRLATAGIVEFHANGGVRLARSFDELTPDEILDAVWVSVQHQAPVQVLVGALEEQQVRVLRSALDLAQTNQNLLSESAWC